MCSRHVHATAFGSRPFFAFKANIQYTAVKHVASGREIAQIIYLTTPFYNDHYYTTPLSRVLVTPRDSNPNCLVIDYVVDSPPWQVISRKLAIGPSGGLQLRCNTTHNLLKANLRPCAGFFREPRNGNLLVMTVPAVPQVCLPCRQSRTLRTLNKVQVLVLATTNHTHPGKKLVMLCGPRTEKRRDQLHYRHREGESCEKGKRAIEVAYRLQSVKDHSGDPQRKRLSAIWPCFRSHMNATTKAMSRSFRNWNGEQACRNNKLPISSKDPTNFEKLLNTFIQRGKTKLSED